MNQSKPYDLNEIAKLYREPVKSEPDRLEPMPEICWKIDFVSSRRESPSNDEQD